MRLENLDETNGEHPELFRFPDEEKPAAESEMRPEKLFRGVSINPDELSVERLRQALVPGTVNAEDPTKVHDGNELGVYMSTNSHMVEAAYSKGGRGVSKFETPQYASDRGIRNGINLPSCGIMYEISTEGLNIRKPKITKVLQGVYNNGFEGQEWIADSVDPKHYKVVKLILSRYANDNEQFVLTVPDNTDDALQRAIDSIKTEFTRRRATAEEFKVFLEHLSETERMNEFKVRREWEKRKKGEPLFPRLDQKTN